METALLIYLYTALGNMVDIIGVIVILLLVAAIAVFAIWMAEYDYTDDHKNIPWLVEKIRKPFIIFMVPALLLLSLYPSKEDMKFIIGGAIAYEGGSALINTDGAQKLPDNLVNAANAFLESIAEKDEGK